MNPSFRSIVIAWRDPLHSWAWIRVRVALGAPLTFADTGDETSSENFPEDVRADIAAARRRLTAD
jgi:hypothetical protein